MSPVSRPLIPYQLGAIYNVYTVYQPDLAPGEVWTLEASLTIQVTIDHAMITQIRATIKAISILPVLPALGVRRAPLDMAPTLHETLLLHQTAWAILDQNGQDSRAMV